MGWLHSPLPMVAHLAARTEAGVQALTPGRLGFEASRAAALVRFSYAASMPESAGKRQRRDVKAKKVVAREKRRVARNKRREDRATGLPHSNPGPSDEAEGAE